MFRIKWEFLAGDKAPLVYTGQDFARMERQKNKEPHGLPKKQNVAPIIPNNPA
jgi:hypothetical protein